ncbi:MAG: Asp23/Gls24 family envelope stress response protein [Corynebacterium sp.]|nr:Asp23/Gls24 family envelope stress response protein [Corynebacterium sp.]
MTDRAHTEITVRALERIALQAIRSVPGTVNVDAKLAGLGGRGFPRVIVQSATDKSVAAVDATIATSWPAPVAEIASSTRSAISAALAEFTGFTTTRVNVTVGEVVPGERVSKDVAQNVPVFTAYKPHTRPTLVQSPQVKATVVRSPQVKSKVQIRSVTIAEEVRKFPLTEVFTPQPLPLRHIEVRTLEVKHPKAQLSDSFRDEGQ